MTGREGLTGTKTKDAGRIVRSEGPLEQMGPERSLFSLSLSNF